MLQGIRYPHGADGVNRYMKIMALAVLLVAGPVAAELAIDIHGASRHIGAYQEYNESNPGVGVAWGSRRVKVTAGGYKNSMGDRTYYAGGEVMTAGTLRLGVVAGAVHGYREERMEKVPGTLATYATVSYTRPRPMIAPVIQAGGVRLMVIPRTDASPTTVAVSYRVPLLL